MTIEVAVCLTMLDAQDAIAAFLERVVGPPDKAIEILEALPGRDYDRQRGYSAWLYVRFPTCNPCQMTPYKAWQMTKAVREAFIERYGYEPPLRQNIEYSAWWRAGPVEEEKDEQALHGLQTAN